MRLIKLRFLGEPGKEIMQKYEVECACFRKVVFEADSQEQANDKAAIMEDEEIEGNSSSEGYVIWEKPHPIN